MLGCGPQLRQGLVHRPVSCLKNVDGVDRPGVGGSNSELDAAGSQRLEKLVPLRASELLGIVQPFEIGRKSVANPFDGKGHHGGDDWTRQRSAPRFIHASDPCQATMQQGPFGLKPIDRVLGVPPGHERTVPRPRHKWQLKIACAPSDTRGSMAA